MNTYAFTIALGGAGLVAMAASGVAHLGGGSSHGHTGSHGTLPHPGSRSGALKHSAPTRDVTGNARATGQAPARATLLAIVSPRILFSLLLGFGITGWFVQGKGAPLFVTTVAVIGALVFERLLIAPVWDVVLRFASTPAVTLDASVLTTARAASGFDTNGQGLVTLEVDGQIVQCLGTLCAEDRALGVRVRMGDMLRVEDVNTVRQQCTVSYVGPDILAE